MSYGTFTLTGRHTTPSGIPHKGQVVVTPNTIIRDTAGLVVMSGSVQVPLDETGAWSLVLPCDDPSLNPSEGIGYKVGYALHSTSMPQQSFYATADMAGSTLDVSDIVTVSVPAPLSAIVGPKGDPGPAGADGAPGPRGDSAFAFDTDGTPYYGPTATPSSRVLVEAAATAAYATAGQKRSKVKVDGTDQTSTLQSELDDLRSAGGGTLILPIGTVTINGTITLSNDGATPPKQPTIRIVGQGAHWSGRGSAPVGGTTLDIKGDDTYGKIKTNGVGLLALNGITFRDSAATATPFLYTTNTTVHVNQCAFVGTKTGISCDQDAIILGGPNQVEGGAGWTDGFQGYGTVIALCFFSGIRTAVKGQAFANAVVVRDNTVWNTCGNPSGAAIEWDGKPATGTQTSAGNVIASNLIEATNYKYAVRLKNSSGCTVAANNVYDATATTTAIYFLDATTSTNALTEGYSSPGKTVLVDNGTNNWFTPTSQGIYSKQPPADFGDINYPARAYGLRAYGPGGYLFQPLTTMPDTGVVFQAKRGPSEATDPSGIVWQVQQNGALVIGSSATSGGNMTGPFSRFTAGGRTWSGVGTAAGQTNGAGMSQDSGPGGSYFDMKNYGVRFFDHNAGPLRMRVGAGKDGFDLGAASDVTVQRDSSASLAVNAAVKTKATTTAARPTAASVGVGGQIFDTTLNKPIWSTGSTWVDASGATV